MRQPTPSHTFVSLEGFVAIEEEQVRVDREQVKGFKLQYEGERPSFGRLPPYPVNHMNMSVRLFRIQDKEDIIQGMRDKNMSVVDRHSIIVSEGGSPRVVDCHLPKHFIVTAKWPGERPRQEVQLLVILHDKESGRTITVKLSNPFFAWTKFKMLSPESKIIRKAKYHRDPLNPKKDKRNNSSKKRDDVSPSSQFEEIDAERQMALYPKDELESASEELAAEICKWSGEDDYKSILLECARSVSLEVVELEGPVE
ncbi:hypothetical protein PROFUN_01438 [Planoprotostelium fungivorum]|uniref:Uncharacterized protein n=1 Tax=Planoprotostelium fungivorum TaxID=1890364 RepID=A0A2P6NTA8_9EUKA|nr:hypothetical protein PROFUN_01438 [Planoprotostelium fungivorum]